MKKAEEYFNEFTKDLPGLNKLAYEFHKLSVLDKIRTIQLNAIEYAVNKCAENAKAELCGQGDYFVQIDYDFIMNTIDQIKEEMK